MVCNVSVACSCKKQSHGKWYKILIEDDIGNLFSLFSDRVKTC